MFNKIEPLDYSKHQELRLAKIPGFNFAKNISAVQLSFSELRHAARYYPIVFLNNAPCLPQALLSLENGSMGLVYEHTHSLSNFSNFLKPAPAAPRV